MIVLGEQYYLIDSFYSNEESYMQLQLNDMIIEFRKRKSQIWKNDTIYYLSLYTLNKDKLIEIPISVDSCDELYQHIMNLYTRFCPFSILLKDIHNMIVYEIWGYSSNDDIVFDISFSKMNTTSQEKLQYSVNVHEDNMEDFSAKFFFFYLSDLYNWDWYNG